MITERTGAFNALPRPVRFVNVRFEGVDELNLARELFMKYDDVGVSLTGCIVFAIMERKKLKRIFTFDSHFWIRELEVVP